MGKVNGHVLGIVCRRVLHVLRCMKVDKSPGPNQIYPRTRQEAREEIAGALAERDASSLTVMHHR